MINRFAAVALLLASGFAWPLTAQDAAPATGRIVGRVMDESGAPVAGAQVRIAASGSATATTGLDGRYTILNVPAGAVALAVRAIGYSPKTVSGINVPAGGAVEQNVALTSQTVQVEELTVTAAAERGTVAAALDEQRTAAGVVNAITAEQIARSPDGDAGQAVQRVSGVTVQDGRYVQVRGLGDRYTTVSLNNARMPSAEPERRVVPLDLFPAGLLEGITTSKTFTVDQPGDFSGGQVNLRTRDFPLRRTFSLSVSTGANDAVTAHAMPRAPTVGREWLGFAGRERRLPGSVRDAGNFSGLSQSERSLLVASFRNVWSARPGEAPANGSTSISLGGEDPLLGAQVGYLFSFGYGNGQDVRVAERRARADADGTGGTIGRNLYRGQTLSSSVLWGGLANLTLRLGGASKLQLTNTVTRGGDNTVTRLAGHNEEFDRDFDITRLGFVERAVRSHQLLGQHLVGARHQVEWSVAGSAVRRLEPDRSDLIMDAAIDSAGTVTPVAWFGQGRSAVRTFSELDESGLDLALNYRLELGASRATAVKVGASRRTVRRHADSRAYQIRNAGLSDAERAQSPAEFVFAAVSGTAFDVIPDAQVGRYDADDAITAGFVQLELPLSGSLRMIGGVRVEQWHLDLTTLNQLGQTVVLGRRNSDVLPALGLTLRLGANTSLRLSATQTVSRPEYREISPTMSRDIAGGYDFAGNDSLQRALIRNFDLRWEWYPSSGEVLSVGLFAKYFDEPIERVIVATTGLPSSSVENSDRARNLGIELEVRRSLGMVAGALAPLGVFANATVMASRIRLKATSQAAQRNVNRPLTGQAAYVVNAGLTWQHPRSDLNATLLYNVVGRRIHEVGSILLPDAWEEPRHMVDFSARFPLLAGVSGKLDVRNILDAPYQVTQGSVVRLRYRTGRTLSAGLSWNP
jgi:hypothetical protein